MIITTVSYLIAAYLAVAFGLFVGIPLASAVRKAQSHVFRGRRDRRMVDRWMRRSLACLLWPLIIVWSEIEAANPPR